MLYILVALFGFYLFFRFSCGINKSSTCLTGKTAIVTGANSGIGYQTALNLAARGCRVIMADIADMTKSRSNIIKFTNNANIVAKHLNLLSFKSVRNFAQDINKTEERLDILINNAGIGFLRNAKRTEDGFHPVMQVNFFSPFLLTHLLIDLLKKSAPSRIVFTSSAFAFTNNLKLENLNYGQESSFLPVAERTFIYGNSKLALLMVSDILAEKLKNTRITSNAVHPGFVHTPIINKIYENSESFFINIIVRVYIFFYSKTQWEGAQGLVHAAVSKKLENVSGKFFFDCKPFIKPWKAYDPKFSRMLWELSEKYVHLTDDEKIKS